MYRVIAPLVHNPMDYRLIPTGCFIHSLPTYTAQAHHVSVSSVGEEKRLYEKETDPRSLFICPIDCYVQIRLKESVY